jgi:hypothetical protein
MHSATWCICRAHSFHTRPIQTPMVARRRQVRPESALRERLAPTSYTTNGDTTLGERISGPRRAVEPPGPMWAGPESNQSPRRCERVSSRRFATRRGKGILRLETAGEHSHLTPKILVSLTLALHYSRARRGYLGNILGVKNRRNINLLRGGGGSLTKLVSACANPWKQGKNREFPQKRPSREQ